MPKSYSDMSEREKLDDGSYVDAGGIIRWNSNDTVPPIDLLEEAGVDQYVIDRCMIAKDADTEKFLTEYVEKEKEFWSNPANRAAQREREFEMRAAFGEGEEVVNVFTGRKHTL